MGDLDLTPGLGGSPGWRHGNPLQYPFLENLHGQKSLVGYSPWSHKEWDMTEQLSTAQHIYIYIFIICNKFRDEYWCYIDEWTHIENISFTDTCICMAESPHCSPETITTLLIGCTPIQNKKPRNKFKKETNDFIIYINCYCEIAVKYLIWFLDEYILPHSM